MDYLHVQNYHSKNLIRVNVTLIFDVAQAILAAKAGAAYVSPFVGRLDDNSIAGLELIKDIDKVYRVQSVCKLKYYLHLLDM